MPDDDVPTGIGGAEDQTIRVVFTDISANDTVEILSDSASDTTQQVEVFGRNTAGEIVSEVETLVGTTPQTTTQSFERILKIVMDGAALGNVTIRKQTDDVEIAVIAIDELEIRRPFYNAAAEASGGAERDYYEKIFMANTHGSLTLTAATIEEFADPSGNVDFDLESSLDGSDNNGAGNRQTQTGGYSFDSTEKDVANSQNLTAGSAQGVWLRLKLPAGEASDNTTFTLRVNGQTTA
jgi:hypothetical protein